MMFDSLDADVEDVEYERFFDKIKRERAEWLAKDLVVDMRESYRDWAWRQLNFVEAPLVPREELPLHMQPQNSIRAKIVNYVNGIDPRLPSQRGSRKGTHIDLEAATAKRQNTEADETELQANLQVEENKEHVDDHKANEMP